jgi:hypothetical protein
MLQKHIFALLKGWNVTKLVLTTHVREWRNHSCVWTPEYVSFSLLYVHISICSKNIRTGLNFIRFIFQNVPICTG